LRTAGCDWRGSPILGQPPAAFVLDASVTMAWALPDEQNEYAARVLRFLQTSAAAAPQMWMFEVAHTIAVSERRARMRERDTTDFLQELKLLRIAVEDTTPTLERLVLAGRAYDTSVYDAAYLDLAMRRGLPVATSDGLMRSAAERKGIGFFDPR